MHDLNNLQSSHAVAFFLDNGLIVLTFFRVTANSFFILSKSSSVPDKPLIFL
jgi:hypothetical protein